MNLFHLRIFFSKPEGIFFSKDPLWPAAMTCSVLGRQARIPAICMKLYAACKCLLLFPPSFLYLSSDLKHIFLFKIQRILFFKMMAGRLVINRSFYRLYQFFFRNLRAYKFP